jgi:hypothetical protein
MCVGPINSKKISSMKVKKIGSLTSIQGIEKIHMIEESKSQQRYDHLLG